MHIARWHKFQFESLRHIYPKGGSSFYLVLGHIVYTRLCPRVSSGTISVPDQRIHGEHRVFVPPVVCIYYNIKEFRITADWNSVI